MLRNRSRAVTTKQALMADQASLHSPTTKPSSPISSFFNSPRFFNGFLNKNLFPDNSSNTETNAIMSPTSILDTKNTSSFVNPFGYDTKILPKLPNPSPETAKQDTKAIGLALIDSIVDEKSDLDESGKVSKPINRTALYGSRLKVQIPVMSPAASSISPDGSPGSPGDFGIKTNKGSQISSPFSKRDFTRQLSLKEMELSEDYTCVITHGPNPKTTHIFDDCVVGRCLGDETKDCEDKKMDCGFENNDVSTSPSFLSFCHTCKDALGQGKDIYIYRGEKAFCSHECRCEEMFFDGMNNPEMDE